MAKIFKLVDVESSTVIDITNKVYQASMSEELDKQVDDFNLECFRLSAMHTMDRVEIYEDSTLLLSGRIVQQVDTSDGVERISTMTCKTDADRFMYRIVAETFTIDSPEAGRPDEIIKTLIRKYAPEYTTNYVNVPITKIDTVLQFKYELLFNCIAKVAELVNWHWYVDNQKNVHFFEKDEGLNPIVFDSRVNMLRGSLKVETDMREPINRVWILGSKYTSPNFFDEYFVGDGQNRLFKLASIPNYTEIYVDGVKQKELLENNDDGSAHFLTNKKEKYARVPDYQPPPAVGANIKIRYRPTIEVIDYFEDPGSVQKYGLFERAVKNRDLTDRILARKYGRTFLKSLAEKRRIATFSTRETSVNVGQRIRLVAPILGVDGEWLVTNISTSLSPSDTIKTIKCLEVI
jgi:hypothetical protein